MTPPRPQPGPRPRGFTIVELLVATAVVILMMTMINQLFFETTNAISEGATRSDVIANANTVNTQLDLDAAAMIGPHDNTTGLSADQSGGVLIIVQKLIGDWNGNGTLDNDSNNNGIIDIATESSTEGVPFPLPGQGGEARRLVRSDQIVWIGKRTSDMFPMGTSTNDAFTPHTDGGRAPNVRIWWGHVSRTNSDGSDANNVTVDFKPADQQSSPGTNFLGRTGLDQLATDFILGRQALFLGEDNQSVGVPYIGSIPSVHANGGWIDTGPATSGNDAIVGYGSSGLQPGFPMYLYMGVTDYAFYSLDDAAGQLNPTNTSVRHNHGAIVGASPTVHTAAQNQGKRLWSTLTSPATNFTEATEPAEPNGFADYRRRAVQHYTFAAKRLRTNVTPTAINTDDTKAWQIAQMHPYLIENCSDFIVEWAGDLMSQDANGTITAATTPDGKIDVVTPGDAGAAATNGVVLAANTIRWYSRFTNDPNIAGFVRNRPVSFAPPTTYTPFVPAMASGAAALPNADAAFVWRHDDEANEFLVGNANQSSQWPYLIRIRYRLHDSNGQLMSGQGGTADLVNTHGMWFEHVIRVKRP